MSKVPFYKTEENFKRYEYFIYQACENYPKTVFFTPQGGRSAVTDTSRCRDAITAWLENGWKTNFNIDPFKTAKLTTWLTPENKIAIGLKSVKRVAISATKISAALDAVSSHQPGTIYGEIPDVVKEKETLDGVHFTKGVKSMTVEVEGGRAPQAQSYSHLGIAEVVRLIESGTITDEVSFDATEENIATAKQAVEGLFNVSHYLKGDKLVIF